MSARFELRGAFGEASKTISRHRTIESAAKAWRGLPWAQREGAGEHAAWITDWQQDGADVTKEALRSERR